MVRFFLRSVYICVFKLETCPMRAIIVAMDLARVVTRQCERIIKVYSVLIFPLVALLHRSTHRSLCERTLHREQCVERRDNAANEKKKNLYVLMIFHTTALLHAKQLSRQLSLA